MVLVGSGGTVVSHARWLAPLPPFGGAKTLKRHILLTYDLC
jgi:hypothetical protein